MRAAAATATPPSSATLIRRPLARLTVQSADRSVGQPTLRSGPFATPAGNTEWMWIEVRSWTGEIFEGVLINEPVEIPDLKYGTTVQVTEAEFFDYRLDKADGSTMGWHATRIQAARQGLEIE